MERFFFASYVIDQSLGGGLIYATPGAHDKLIVPKASGSQVQHVVSLVDSILSAHKQLAAAKSAAQKAIIQRQIDATDARIDRLVYSLYNLSIKEIGVVEGKA